LKISGRTVEIKGFAKQREIIPILSEALGGANLRRVTRATLHEKRVFNFVLDKNIGIQRDTQNLQLLTGLTNAKQKTKGTDGSTGTNGHSKKGKNK